MTLRCFTLDVVLRAVGFVLDEPGLTGSVRYRGEFEHPLAIIKTMIIEINLGIVQGWVRTDPIKFEAALRFVSFRNESNESRISSPMPGFLKLAVPT